VVQTVHNFLNRGMQVPVMDVKDVNIVGAKIFETTLDAKLHGFDVVAEVVDLLLDFIIASVRGVCVLVRESVLCCLWLRAAR
jgi:hypothetical protein